MLYTKKIEDITWDDVEDFCKQGVHENTYLDYKEDFPKELEKTIAAMANVLGGMIIIGVEEDNTNRPKTPIKGITFSKGLSEKITQIILSNISPPIFPEIQVCQDNTKTKAAIIIRISQSVQTPHAIRGNTSVYLRTNNLNNPEELATIDKIAWLKDNRKLSIDMKLEIGNRADKRYQFYLEEDIRKQIKDGSQGAYPNESILTLSICPSFPSNTYFNPPELADLINTISVDSRHGTICHFPIGSGFPKIVHDGIVLTHCEGIPRFYYTEINNFGLYFFRHPLTITRARTIRASEVISLVDGFLASSMKLLEEIGYWGYLDFSITVSDISNIKLAFNWIGSSLVDTPLGICPDKYVNFQRTFLANELQHDRDKLIFVSTRDIFWGFGLDLTDERYSLYLKKNMK